MSSSLLSLTLSVLATNLLAQNSNGPYPRPEAKFSIQLERNIAVPMRDGVRLAIDVWRSNSGGAGERSPCLLLTTRYWRSLDLTHDA